MFRVDTLTTPPKAVTNSGEERWISSSTLFEEQENDERRSNPGAWSPVSVLRTPVLAATPDQNSTNRRSPTPHLLREQSPGVSSPLTPLHFIRRASVEPGLAPNTTPIRERSPGVSSDGGSSGAPATGTISGRRPRLSASSTLSKHLQTPSTPVNQIRRWR